MVPLFHHFCSKSLLIARIEDALSDYLTTCKNYGTKMALWHFKLSLSKRLWPQVLLVRWHFCNWMALYSIQNPDWSCSVAPIGTLYSTYPLLPFCNQNVSTSVSLSSAKFLGLDGSIVLKVQSNMVYDVWFTIVYLAIHYSPVAFWNVFSSDLSSFVSGNGLTSIRLCLLARSFDRQELPTFSFMRV